MGNGKRSEAVGDQSVGGIIGGNAHLDAIPDHHFDPMLFHSSRKYAPNNDVVVTLDFHGATTEDFGDFPL